MARLIWLLTGGAWAVASLILFANPSYWDPVTVLDWTAVWSYTAAWLLLAPSVLLIARLSSSRSATAVAAVCAVGAIVAGGANAIEDGFGVSAGGSFYVVGFLTGLLSLIPLGAALWRASYRRLAGLVVAILLGIALLTVGGGILVFCALGSIALVPGRFARARSAPDSTAGSHIKDDSGVTPALSTD